MESKRRSRRGFLRGAVKAGTLLAAALGGLVPELSAHAQGVGSAPVTPNTGTAPLPIVPPLDPASQAALYSLALNDSDVTLLLGTLSESGRLDPPTQSSDIALDSNVRSQQIIMPVIGYSSGSVLAYLIYGSASGMTYNGASVPVSVKNLMSNAGVATFAVNGSLQDASAIDPMPTLFACLFPDEFSALFGASLPVVSNRQGFVARFMRNTAAAAQADTPGAICYRQAQRALAACIRTANAAQAALGTFGAAVLCIAFALLVVGTAGATAFAWAFFCGATVAGFAIAVLAYKQDLAACETIFEGAVATCRRNNPATA